MKNLPGDSKEQQDAEKWLVSYFAQGKGVKLVKKKWTLLNGSWVESDGFCESPRIICEAWAHIGIPKSAQKNKVMTDVLKMLFIDSLEKSRKSSLVLLFGDEKAAEHFKGKSWMATCLKRNGIEVKVIKFPEEIKEKILKAQERQYR